MWRILTSYYLNISTFSLIYKVFNIRQENTCTDSYLTNRDWAAACVPVKPGGAAGPVLPVPSVSSHDYPVAVGGGGWGGGGVCTLTSLLAVFFWWFNGDLVG